MRKEKERLEKVPARLHLHDDNRFIFLWSCRRRGGYSALTFSMRDYTRDVLFISRQISFY